jgi:hypothetical protein
MTLVILKTVATMAVQALDSAYYEKEGGKESDKEGGGREE